MPVYMLNGSNLYFKSLSVEVQLLRKLSIQLISSSEMHHFFRLCRSL